MTREQGRVTAVAAVGIGLGLTATFGLSAITSNADTSAVTPETVVTGYADIALAGYTDSLSTAHVLKTAVEGLLADPSDETLTSARRAWIAARVPYQQTEVYRFGNALVDDWEGKVNAWPLDEGLIDYVDTGSGYGFGSDNPAANANIIANVSVTMGGTTVDAATISKTLIAETLHEFGGAEANVATGYHAIEFLLWGQDLNGTEAGAGNRPATDFSLDNCSNGNCDRRRMYLTVATDLLIDDLEEMVNLWGPSGAARQTVLEDPNQGLIAMITGMGSLSYGELAGERMKLGLLLGDPEEEHDCFSDNTHNSHFYNVQGIANVYSGTYTRADGSVLSVAPFSALVSEASADADTAMAAALGVTQARMGDLVTAAENGEAYDQMISPGNEAGNARVQAAIDALVAQTQALETVVSALGISSMEFEGSDSLDDPEAVFQ